MLTNYRGIVTAIAGIVIAITGWLFGPVDIGEVHIPQIPFELAMGAVWIALLAIFNSLKGNKIFKSQEGGEPK